MQKIKIEKNLINERLDKALSICLPSVSRSKLRQYIDDGLVLVNNKQEKASYKLRENDELFVNDFPSEEYDLEAEDISLDIVYEDDDIMVINKPKGLVVHPGAGNWNHTLANALKFHSDKLSSLNGDFRPGIVHRLDKDTGGLLIIAKNDESHAFLANQLADHTLGRNYYALVLGTIGENEGKIIAPIGRDDKYRQKMAVDLRDGKYAETNFKVIERFANATLVDCALKTGRTHQIRVHMSYIRHHVVGDGKYGDFKVNNMIEKEYGFKNQFLHASEVHFGQLEKPLENLSKRCFKAPLPDEYNDLLNKLRDRKKD